MTGQFLEGLCPTCGRHDGDEVGRCGNPSAALLLAGGETRTSVCRLPHGHPGWHRGDDGSEWTHGERDE